MGPGVGSREVLVTRRVRVLLSTACAALSVMLFATYASHVREEAERVRIDALERYGGEVVTLAVARTALEPGDVVTSSNVTMHEWVSALAPEGAVTSFEDVAGLEVGVPLSKGAPLTDVTFRSASEMAEVPAGCVAVTLTVTDKLGIPRSVAVGSTLAAYETSSSGSKLISEGMTVLSSPGASGSLASSLQITVAVPADDVTAVLSASATNDLRLVMPAKDVAEEGALGGSGAPVEIEPEGEAGGKDAEGKETNASGKVDGDKKGDSSEETKESEDDKAAGGKEGASGEVPQEADEGEDASQEGEGEAADDAGASSSEEVDMQSAQSGARSSDVQEG